MKFSELWLREWVDPHINSEQLATQLTMAGLEVDAVALVANEFNNVVVGEVLEVQPHPNADRLRVCQVNVGQTQPITIVCGAANVRPGMKAPVAIEGAKLSSELIIKKTKLRGVESYGMLCSAAELGLAEKSEGLMELPADAPIGTDLRKFLQLDDHIFELKVTPNRGDCLSIAGVAREVSAINKCKITLPTFKKILPINSDTFPIHLNAPRECPRYVGRIIRNINPNISSPLWLKERLRRSGIRSVHPVVDIGNYVMLELGQPMHAFDLSKLQQNIEVRRAKPNEKIILLNEQEVSLDQKTLVIADAKSPHAIAGLMGGLHSSINESTTDIFLESAYFDPLTIAHAVRHYGLQSDAAHRFERGVDPELQIQAMERASELIISLVDGEPGPIIEAVDKSQLPSQKTIRLRRSRIQRILGISIADNEVKDILNRLNLTVTEEKEGWIIKIPSYRFDLHLEIDIIEELARIYGYNKIPTHLPTVECKAKSIPETNISLTRIRTLLTDRDYHEAITYSFVSPKLQELLDSSHKPKALINPISYEMGVMRTSLWPGLIQATLYNQNRQESRIRLFETGLCFIEEGGELHQQMKLAGVISGFVYPEQWGMPKSFADFFDVKGDVEAILSLTKDKTFTFAPSSHPTLQPNQSAEIYRGGKSVGHFGTLHPSIAELLGIEDSIFLFELNLTDIKQGIIPSFNSISKFPAVRRDIAIVLNQEIPATEVQQTIVHSTNDLLKNTQIFDIYQGKGIEVGKKSVALGLIFQHPSRTLTDEEINQQISHIVGALEQTFNAKLRE